MKQELDECDNKILALLMDDARLPVATIAKQVGIARTTAIARIANLEKMGVIAGYGVRLNHALYQPAVRAYVGISMHPGSAATLIN
ncbi:MAG: Lrp/AsnC family transcriptional regulator, partial [Glaciimonas sp.]|nr:Lrp/AsnC family transcriptional regulator [Glaciimonas sp.]